MLTLTFLGVGNAFAKRNLQSNALVEAWTSDPQQQKAPDNTLLIDFGTTGPIAMDKLRAVPGFEYLDTDGVVDYRKIGQIFITHQHADHFGGLEEMALMNAYVLGAARSAPAHKPRLISSRAILDPLWSCSLSGGLRVVHGRRAELADFFEPHPLPESGPGARRFALGDRYTCEAVPTPHVSSADGPDCPAFGLMLSSAGAGPRAYYSGDTRFVRPALEAILQEVDMCFHDVQLFDQVDPVHTLLSELRGLEPALKRKMHLYHYGDNWDSGEFDFVATEFAGFAAPWRRYVLSSD